MTVNSKNDYLSDAGAFGMFNNLAKSTTANNSKRIDDLTKKLGNLSESIKQVIDTSKSDQDSMISRKIETGILNNSKQNNDWLKKIYEVTKDSSYETGLSIMHLAKTLQESLKAIENKGSSAGEISLGGGLPLGGLPLGRNRRGRLNIPKGGKNRFIDKLFKGYKNKGYIDTGEQLTEKGSRDIFGRYGTRLAGVAEAGEGEAALGGLAAGEGVAEGGAVAAAGVAGSPLLIAGAVAAAVAGAYEIFTHWKETKAFAKQAGNVIGDLAKQGTALAGSAIKAAIPAAQDMLKNLFKNVQGDGGEEFKRDATNLFDGVKKGLLNALNMLSDKIGDVLANAQQWMDKTFSPENIKKMFDDALALAMKLAKQGADAAVNIAQNAPGAIAKGGAAVVGGISAAANLVGKGAEALIGGFEGLTKNGKAYKDAGHIAIGYGHDLTKQELKQGYVQIGKDKIELHGLDTRLTKAQSQELLKQDLATRYQPDVIKALGNDAWNKLNQDQKNALISYAYNTGGIKDLLRKGLKEDILSGNMNAAASLIANGISTSKGVKNDVLVTRRGEEAAVFANSTTVGPAMAQTGPKSNPSDMVTAKNQTTNMPSPAPKPSPQVSAPSLPSVDSVPHSDDLTTQIYNTAIMN